MGSCQTVGASLIADNALYNAENLQPLTQTSLKWITRVPATLTEAQDALGKADPQAMLPLMEGYRDQLLASHYALLMVMTVCLLVYAALEYRIRHALKAHQTIFPNQKGQPVQNPIACWVFQSFVGLHLLRIPGKGAFVLNLNDQHRQLLRILRRRHEVVYA